MSIFNAVISRAKLGVLSVLMLLRLFSSVAQPVKSISLIFYLELILLVVWF